MTARVLAALEEWGLTGAHFHLAAARENQVYKVDHDGKSFALRLHRPGYRTNAELRSELDWMAALACGGLDVPAPVANQHGAYLSILDTVQVDVLTWLPGHMLSDSLNALDTAARANLFHQLGQDMAALHEISDAWRPGPDFTRADWNSAGLLGEDPLWGRFWENPELSPQDRTLFLQVREHAALLLTTHDLDYGLIHADLVPANVMVDGDRLRFIDFDDGGWGFRLFDVATALLKHRNAQDYADLEAALIAGYRRRRALDADHFDLMMALRALTYVGWNIARMSEDGAVLRNRRFIDTARELCAAYLG